MFYHFSQLVINLFSVFQNRSKETSIKILISKSLENKRITAQYYLKPGLHILTYVIGKHTRCLYKNTVVDANASILNRFDFFRTLKFI